MYCDNVSIFVNIIGLIEGLCGVSRLIYFRGVCIVVSKLFNIILVDRVYFGEKDV